MIRVVIEHDRTIWKVSCFAADHDLVFYDKIGASAEQPEEVIWATRDGDTRLHRIEDPYAGLAYLQIDGDRAPTLAVHAETELDGLTAEMLLAAMAGRSNEAVSPPAVAALGVLAPRQADPKFIETFRWLFAHDDPSVRTAAVAATAYPAWPELISELERLAASDPEESVRAYAAKAESSLKDATDGIGKP